MYHKAKSNEVVIDCFHGKYPSKRLNNQINYLNNVQRELDARQTKVANTLYRNKLREHQNTLNYTNELHRVRGILSQNDTRLPIGTRERLNQRVDELKKLGAKIADKM
jgi:hypothetical protein